MENPGLVPYCEYFYPLNDLQKLEDAFALGILKEKPTPDQSEIRIQVSGNTVQVLYDRYGILPTRSGLDKNEAYSALFAPLRDKANYLIGSSDVDQLYTQYLDHAMVRAELESFDNNDFCTIDLLEHPSHGYKNILPERPRYLRMRTNTDPGKLGVLIVSGMHGDEWFAVHSTLELIKSYIIKFREHLGGENEAYGFLDQLDLFFIPVLNPDGYRYNIGKNRGWRKNLCQEKLKGQEAEHLVGVDLNRNFPVYFGWDKATHNRESEQFHGLYPLSEPETQNITWILREYPHIQVALDVHSDGDRGIYRPLSEVKLDGALANGTRSFPGEIEHFFQKAATSFVSTVGRSRTNYSAKFTGVYAGAFDESMLHFYKTLGFCLEVHEDARPRLYDDKGVRVAAVDEAMDIMQRAVDSIIQLSVQNSSNIQKFLEKWKKM